MVLIAPDLHPWIEIQKVYLCVCIVCLGVPCMLNVFSNFTLRVNCKACIKKLCFFPGVYIYFVGRNG